MSENKENKAMENNNSALQRPGSVAGMTPEITEPAEKEPVNKAPLQDIDSPFKVAKWDDGKNAEEPAKADAAATTEAKTTTTAKAEAPAKKKSKKKKKDDAFAGLTEEEAEEEIRRQHKRRKRRAITLVAVLAVLVAGAILLPNLLKFVAPKADNSAVNVNENVLEYKVAKTSIVRDFTASGTLAAGDTEDIKIAGDIEVEEYFVKNGDVISKGDKIASVSKASVMSAIVDVQNTIKKVDKKLNSINSSEDKTVIKADSPARVKKIYVKKGSNAQNTITKNGALILLSLDGLMACDITRTSDTKLGASVTVILSDKTKIEGVIASVTTEKATCVISDKVAAYQDKVTVLDASGKELGTSELYIHNVLPIIAYSGTVSKVSVKVNQYVKKGAELLTITGTKYSGEFSNLMYKRSVLEDQMKTLFELYQTGIVYSDHDGEVTGIKDEDEEEEEEEESTTKSEKLASSTKKLGSLKVKLIDDASSNPPENPTSAAGYTDLGYIVKGFGKSESFNLHSKKTVEPLTDTDYTNPSELKNRDQYTYNAGDFTFGSSVHVYTYDKKKGWVQGKIDDIAIGDFLILTYDNASAANADPVWIIRYPQTSSGGQGGQSGQGGQGGESGQGGQGGWNGQGGRGGGNFDWSSLFGGRGGRGSFSGGISGYTGSGTGAQSGTGTEKEEETYEVEEKLIASIINLDTMSLTLSVDELDVININKTQEVSVTLDAVKDKTYTGKIVSINTDGTRSTGGNAKYSVKITLDRTDEMLTNMTASVRANISTAEVISVPAEALIEKNNKTYCYTSYDKENDTLSGEVEVKTGISDGKNVEILSGLNEGDAIWYKYADGFVYKFVR